MTFNYDNEDISKVIKHFKKENNNYTIKYLDGTTTKYYNSNENHEQELLNRMLNDAIKRDKEYYSNYKKNKLIEIASYMTTILFFIQTNNIAYKQINILFWIGIILSFLSLSITAKIKYQSKEIKKYHDYLSIIEKLDKENNANLIIDYGNGKEKILNINNLDFYSNNEIKLLLKIKSSKSIK